MNFGDIFEADPDRGLMLAHVPPPLRAAVASLWRLDLKGADIVRTTSEVLLGRMRLTWWHEALTALDNAPPRSEPLLIEAAASLVSAGTSGHELAEAMVGWEALLVDQPFPDDALDDFATARGGGLFGIAAQLLGASDPRIVAAGRGWALVDLALHVGDAETRQRALAMARQPLEQALIGRWPRALRPLAMLAAFAERDRKAGADRARSGSPARMLTALRFRFIGH